jgi:cyclopropane-fatty-acyl-phospholipid synthase
MFEHVRYENYNEFFKMIKRCLKPSGKCLIHTIVSLEKISPHNVNKTFISKHIFPGGQIPVTEWIIKAIIENELSIIHIEYFGGQHYAKTLNQWNKNMFDKSDYIIEKYGKNLLLKYEYYFKICEAVFTSGMMGISHILITNDITVNCNNNFNYRI